MSHSYDSITTTTESGAFIRTVTRKGKRRKQKTIRIKKNDKKVTLGYIGEFEVYIYPYNYPDTVFVGTFPISTILDSGNINQLLGVYNKIKSYLAGYYFNKPNTRKGANSRRRKIKMAYNTGLLEERSKKNPTIN